jgi:hypothetical protein
MLLSASCCTCRCWSIRECSLRNCAASWLPAVRTACPKNIRAERTHISVTAPTSVASAAVVYPCSSRARDTTVDSGVAAGTRPNPALSSARAPVGATSSAASRCFCPCLYCEAQSQYTSPDTRESRDTLRIAHSFRNKHRRRRCKQPTRLVYVNSEQPCDT